MAIQLLVSAVYQTVRHSWLFAAVAVKYILAAQLVELAYRDDLSVESFREKLRDRSDEAVTGIVLAGFVLAVTGYRPSAFLKPLSEFIALAYFAYLFWSY